MKRKNPCLEVNAHLDLPVETIMEILICKKTISTKKKFVKTF